MSVCRCGLLSGMLLLLLLLSPKLVYSASMESSYPSLLPFPSLHPLKTGPLGLRTSEILRSTLAPCPGPAPFISSPNPTSLMGDSAEVPSRHFCHLVKPQQTLAWAIRLFFLRARVIRSVFTLPSRATPTLLHVWEWELNPILSVCFAISWITESIVFKSTLGNNSPAIKNYAKLLYFELVMLNHAGLGCGSMAEHLLTTINYLPWVLCLAR